MTKQINIAIEKRCKNFITNKKLMLNSLLKQDNRSIVIDKLIQQNPDGSEDLISDETKKLKLKNHFAQITNFRHIFDQKL
jgi:hypothetical protein